MKLNRRWPNVAQIMGLCYWCCIELVNSSFLLHCMKVIKYTLWKNAHWYCRCSRLNNTMLHQHKDQSRSGLHNSKMMRAKKGYLELWTFLLTGGQVFNIWRHRTGCRYEQISQCYVCGPHRKCPWAGCCPHAACCAPLVWVLYLLHCCKQRALPTWWKSELKELYVMQF